MYNPHNIHPDLQFAVLCNAIRNADIEKFMQLWDFMLDYNDDREIFIKSLACTENLEAFLHIKTEYMNTKFSNRDRRLMLLNFAQHYKYGVFIVDEWLRRHLVHFDLSEERFMLNTILKRVNTNYKLDQFANFATKFTNQGNYIKETIDTFVNISKHNVNWLKENKEEILIWLEQHLRPSITESSTESEMTTESIETTDLTTPSSTNNLNACYILTFISSVFYAYLLYKMKINI
jgi:hypothetical protein